MTHTSFDCYDDQQKVSPGQATNWCCSGFKYEFWIFLETISQNISSQNKPLPNVNSCCQLYCTCVHSEIVCPYCTCLVCLFCSQNELSMISFSIPNYKNLGNNQLPCYLQVLKPLIQVNVSTRTVPGGKHLAPLMLATKLPVTPMDGRHHPRPMSPQ